MTPDRQAEIETAIIRAMSAFGVDPSMPYQSMGLIGLAEMRRDIPRNEFMMVLQSMEGVIVDFDISPAEVHIPTSLFL
jgi:hypothetical protein